MLIYKAEESMDVFGDAVNEAEKKGDGSGDGDGDDEVAPPAAGEGEEDDADDLQIAWENLESARHIYEVGNIDSYDQNTHTHTHTHTHTV